MGCACSVSLCTQAQARVSAHQLVQPTNQQRVRSLLATHRSHSHNISPANQRRLHQFIQNGTVNRLQTLTLKTTGKEKYYQACSMILPIELQCKLLTPSKGLQKWGILDFRPAPLHQWKLLSVEKLLAPSKGLQIISFQCRSMSVSVSELVYSLLI